MTNIFLLFPEIVCSAIGESVPVQDTVKAGIPGAISAGLSTGSLCTGAVIGELEGWGDLWTLKAEGTVYYTGTSPLIHGVQRLTTTYTLKDKR